LPTNPSAGRKPAKAAILDLPRQTMPTEHGFPSAAAGLPHRPSRRSFLRIGALGLGGLSLLGLLRAEAAAGIRASHKSIILIYLVGGPPHQDLFDLKPLAPKENAGPWKPITTKVTGVQICEALPRLVRIMDKLVVVRSLVGNQAYHDAIQSRPREYQCLLP
jgi:hypothetical protein